MPRQILSAALQRAAHSDASIEGPALLHTARVMTTFDRPEAESVLERGIAIITELSGLYRSILLDEAVSLVAAVSPRRAFGLLPLLSRPAFPGRIDKVIYDMLRHGYVEAAVSYLSEPTTDYPFYPFSAACEAMVDCANNPEAQVRILRGAVSAMIEGGQKNSFPDRSSFAALFDRHWRLLPTSEAAAVIRKLLQRILEEPDLLGDYSISGLDGTAAHFSSTKEFGLFEILGPLRHLDPSLADLLFKQHLQLANAAAIFPYGYQETIEETQRAREPVVPEQDLKPGVSIEWDDVTFQWIPASEWLRHNFEDKFQQALALCRADTTPSSPNTAPKECWPSTQRFRTLLYKTGRYEGRAAVSHLDRIPDADVRLFAQIELAAGLTDLPEIGGSSMPRMPAGTTML